MKPQHLSDVQATTAVIQTSMPILSENMVLFNLKLAWRKKKKSQQNKEAPGGCGWKAPRKHELDVDSQPPHMHEHVAGYSKLYTQSRSLHET